MRRHVYPRSSVPLVTRDLEASPPPPHTTPARLVLMLALEADCDPRSARRALEEGAEAIRGRVGERLALAAKSLGIALGQSVNPSEPPGSAA